jgi:hypothetical protein
MKEKVYYTIIGERYDNNMADELSPDEIVIDDYLLFNAKTVLTIDDSKRLRKIKDAQPYRDRDFKLVEVLPFRDHTVDFSKIVFDISYVFEPDEKISTDGESILMELQHVRILAQTGVLFGIISSESLPDVITKIKEDDDERQDFEDTMESYYTYGPVEHEPDLPIVPKLSPPDTGIKKRIVKEKPVFYRKRRHVLTEPVM